MESSRWDKFRILTIALIFSGALNIGLLMALVFSALDQPEMPLAAAKLKSQTGPLPANRQLLGDMLKLSFSELVVHLTNRDPVEEGYTKRDLALSALVASHNFNLEKALSSAPLQKRLAPLSSELTVELFPGLTDQQYEAVIRFAYQEKWPLTAKGLFLMLKKWPKNGREASLCEAFFATAEFYALQVLFQKTDAAQDPYSLLPLSLEGPWDVLERFAKEQAALLDLSVEKRRSLLLAYTSYRSSTAAELLIKTDYLFAKTRIEDAGILALLDLLNEKSATAERFCSDLLRSPRSDSVLKAAADKLYAFAGETAPVPFDLQTSLARFATVPAAPVSAPAAVAPPAPAVKAAAPVAASKPTPPARLREHTVQEGESLWKIARQYKVKVDDLVQLNELEKDRLLPGMVLRIPQGTGSEPPR